MLLIALLSGAGLSAAPFGAPSAAAATSAAGPAKSAAPSAKAQPAKARPANPQPAREQPAATSVSEQRKLAAAAARQVLAQSAVPDTCSGPISPDTIYPCSTPSSSGTDTFTITITHPTDQVYILPVSATTGYVIGFTLTAPDSSTVRCQQTYTGQYVCPTSQAGTYTLAVGSTGSAYTLDYTALLSDTGCTAINPSFAAPAIADSLAAGQAGSCYTLDVPSGSVLDLMGLSASAFPTALDVYDSTGANQNCDLLGGENCTVGGTAPYRIFIYSNGATDTYQLQLNSLTNPQGCVATPQLAYGQVPDTSSTDPCRTITVTTAGSYQVVPLSATGAQMNGTVYAANGSVACQYYQYPFCPLAVGSYDFVAASGQTGVPFGFVFIAGNESSGCTATGDTDFQNGPATGKFAGTGEETCLTLPTPNGKADYFLEQQNPDGTYMPNVEVIDATGALQCGGLNADFNYDTCTLSGTAPFRVLLSAASATDSYRILIQRTDSTAGCPAWQQSGFGGSYGATVTLTASDDVKCLTIPAGQHSTGEMIDYSNAANAAEGTVYVNDPSGNEICRGASLGLCTYQPHVTYTALAILVNSNSDTWHLVRRDVSATAKCATPASTTVGGPSTTFTLTSDLDTTCYRVTAAATDKLWFSDRTVAPAPAGAVLLVTDASGGFVCRQFGTACQVSGSTDYQVVVDADNYSGTAITTHLDTWLVGTAAGWAPQCQQNQFSAASGWGPLSGTLTENAAGYCAVVNLEPQQSFGIFGTDTAVSPNSVDLSIYTAASWGTSFAGLTGLCYQPNYGQFGFTCQVPYGQAATQAVLVMTPGTSQTPVGYTMQAVCQVTCASPPQPATITSITPSSQPTGPNNTIVVTGTGLNLGTQVQLASNGSPASYSQIAFPQSVNADGTQLTLRLDTTGVTPGTYDVVLNQAGYVTGTPSPGYLPGAYTVTAAS